MAEDANCKRAALSAEECTTKLASLPPLPGKDKVDPNAKVEPNAKVDPNAKVEPNAKVDPNDPNSKITSVRFKAKKEGMRHHHGSFRRQRRLKQLRSKYLSDSPSSRQYQQTLSVDGSEATINFRELMTTTGDKNALVEKTKALSDQCLSLKDEKEVGGGVCLSIPGIQSAGRQLRAHVVPAR